jgi:hypothetical protein
LLAHLVKGLAVDPEARHASMGELLAALEDARARRAPARRPIRIAAAALSLALLAGGGAIGSTRGRDPGAMAGQAAVPSTEGSTSPIASEVTPAARPSAEAASAPAASTGPSTTTRKASIRPRPAAPRPSPSARYDDAPMEPSFARKK